MKAKIFYYRSCLVIILLLTVSLCAAQEKPDTSMYRIETRDGNTYMGQIVSQDSVKVILNSDKLGEIKISRSDIKSMYPIKKEKIINGEYWFENPQATRYFYAPNGNALKKGEGYYQNVWVLFSSFAVGIEDNFSIGGGLVPLFLFAGAPTPVWITPKVSIPLNRENFSFGAGGLLGTVIGEEDTGFGILYGISTLGSKDKNLSLGLGYGYAGGEWAKTPMINLSAMVRMGPRGYLLTENYYIRTGNTTTAILCLGGRQIIKDWGLDYGLIIPINNEMEDFIAIPWLGITIPFGGETGKK
jgi:hypothetical protein